MGRLQRPLAPLAVHLLSCALTAIHTRTPLHCSITQPLPAEQQSALQLLPNFRVLDDNGGGQVGIAIPMTPVTPWRMNEEAG
jgi:hypothetical protein